MKTRLVAEFLCAQASWRLAEAGSDPVAAARCAAALLDAAAYVAALADDDRDLLLLSRRGCFRGDAFDPGPVGRSIARRWQFSGGPQAGPRDLIAALALAADQLTRTGIGDPSHCPGDIRDRR